MTRHGGRIRIRCNECGLSVHDCDETTYEGARDDARAAGWVFVHHRGSWFATCAMCIPGAAA